MRPGGGTGARRANELLQRAGCGVSLAAAAVGLLMLTPTAHGAARLASRQASAASTLSRHAPDAPPTLTDAQAFSGTPAVGALFTLNAGQLGKHFCTASVVDSSVMDLVITAAHCVSKRTPGQIAFVPGYHDGVRPHGVWTVSHIVTDRVWQASANIDHDVAFLVVHQTGNNQPIQDVTGGEHLGIGWRARVWVHVLGYPNRTQRPIRCAGWTKPFGAHQMEFDCGGFTDGTSGGPFLARVDATTGEGTVIGVIGGYEQGGDIASVSYSPRFGTAVQSLYWTAVARG